MFVWVFFYLLQNGEKLIKIIQRKNNLEAH